MESRIAAINMPWSPAEQHILEALEAAMHAPHAAALLAATADEVTAELAGNPAALLAWRPIPLSTYGRLPEGIASSWVFVLRARRTSGAERHPNSIQRVMSYRGSADMQTWDGRAWVSHRLSSDPHAFADPVAAKPGATRMGRPIQDRWLSIPVNVWHRPVMGAEDWVVVSFHTAADDQLIEELAADDEHPDFGPASAQPYAGRRSR